MIRDLLHLAAILTVAAYMSWLIGSTIVGAIAALIDAWREDREHFRWAAEEIAEIVAARDQDLIDAGVIRASRPAQCEGHSSYGRCQQPGVREADGWMCDPCATDYEWFVERHPIALMVVTAPEVGDVR